MANTFDLTSFPTARNDATEDKWTKYAQALITNGVLSNVANEMEVFADSTGMVIKVKTGRCFVDGVAGDLTTQQSLDVAAADPSNPRLDRVVARLTTTSPATVAIKVITGVAASTPTAPALLDDATHTDIPLATVRVEALAGTIAAGKVTVGRTWVQPGSDPLSRLELRGDQSAIYFRASDGTGRGLFGPRSDATPSADDLIWQSVSGDLYLAPAGVTSVKFPALDSVAISVPSGDLDLVGGVIRYNATNTSSTATAGGVTLPATPAGFLHINIGGTTYKLPFYNS